MSKCKEFKRGPSYFEGCSHVVCPQRKQLTAAVVGERFVGNSFVGIKEVSNVQGIKRYPTTKDDGNEPSS